MTLHRDQLSVDPELRVADGNTTCGRLEVFAFDAWRPVCSDGFDNIDATVACINLGFGYVCVCECVAGSGTSRQTPNIDEAIRTTRRALKTDKLLS